MKNTYLQYFTSKEKSKLIIDYLKINDIGITKTRLAGDLKIHINTTTKYLTFLEQFQIILKEKFSGKILYFLNEEFIEV